MRYWLLTDTHFGHANMHDFCGRPVGFESKILSNLWETVCAGDTLIHLGDFCIGEDEVWHQLFMDACEGERWLIRGNHDTKSDAWYLDHGWDRVMSFLHLIVGEKSVVLSHIPIADKNRFDLNIHGHHHNTNHHPEDIVTEKHRLIFVEHHYNPVLLNDLFGEHGIHLPQDKTI